MKDIDFGKIVSRSWELTWKYKWLWVMGLVLAVFGGSSFGSGSSDNSGSTGNLNTNLASPAPKQTSLNVQNLQGTASRVLGAATDVVKSWFTSIPAGDWVLLGFLVLILIIVGVAITLVLTSWAKGSLIAGFEDADAGAEVTLRSASKKGTTKIKDLIIFELLSFLIVIGTLICLALLVGIGFLIKITVPALGTIWMVLFGILGGLAFVITIFFFAMLTIYAERLIVLKNYSPWDAWKKGLSLSKGNFLPTLVMGLINSVIGCVSSCLGIIALLIVFAAPGYLLIYPMFKGSFHFPGAGTVIGLIILVLLFVSINSLLRAVYVVFDYGNWNLFFKQILSKTENEQQQ
jgi:hypothetical protein